MEFEHYQSKNNSISKHCAIWIIQKSTTIDVGIGAYLYSIQQLKQATIIVIIIAAGVYPGATNCCSDYKSHL